MIVAFVILLVIGACIFSAIAGVVARTRERGQQHNRCAHCRSRLKKRADGLGWALTCGRCGQPQPWRG